MRAVELMETLAKAVVENPKVDVSFMIIEEDIKDLETMEGTNFFDIRTEAIPEEDVFFIPLKKGINT